MHIVDVLKFRRVSSFSCHFHHALLHPVNAVEGHLEPGPSIQVYLSTPPIPNLVIGKSGL